MKKNALFLFGLAVIFAYHTSCSDNSEQKAVSATKDIKPTFALPEEIRKNIPEEMCGVVFLHMVCSLIKNEYVNEISDDKITEKIIMNFLASLDPHSSYLNEKAIAALKNQVEGEFGGLGIEIMIDEGFIRVLSPVDDTPAYKAGLKSGDLIIYIGDECVNGISAEEAVDRLRGKPKTKVKLKIKRNDKPPFDIVIERAIIKIKSVKCEILDRVGYVRISTFDTNTYKDLKKFVEDNKSNVDGLLIDLRNNPGGLLEECVAVSDMFLEKGQTIVQTRGRLSENTAEYKSKGGDITNGLPVVILINSATASAPEIFAGALKDNKRAIVVGVRSFGKGSVQKLIPISEKSAIKLTVAKHYTPTGRCIQADGIMPDIVAESAMIKKFDVFCVREESLNNALDSDQKEQNKKKTDEENKKALDALSNKQKKGSSEKDNDEDFELTYRRLPLKEKLEMDFQLSKAFDIVKTLITSLVCVRFKKHL